MNFRCGACGCVPRCHSRDVGDCRNFNQDTAQLCADEASNGVDHEDLISVIFTATEDVVSTFPATAARTYGLGDVPLICARELSITGGTPMCIRVLMHLVTDRTRQELHHVYLEGARGLRDDLPD